MHTMLAISALDDLGEVMRRFELAKANWTVSIGAKLTILHPEIDLVDADAMLDKLAEFFWQSDRVVKKIVKLVGDDFDE